MGLFRAKISPTPRSLSGGRRAGRESKIANYARVELTVPGSFSLSFKEDFLLTMKIDKGI